MTKAAPLSPARTGWLSMAGVALAAGAATTCLATPAAALYALPAAIAFAVAVLLVPRASRGEHYYSMTDAVFLLIVAGAAGAATLVAMLTVPALTPAVDLTARQYRDLEYDLRMSNARPALLAPAAADGRIDLRELVAYQRAVKAADERDAVDRVIAAARAPR